jgi:hypothetical protein
MRPAGGVLRLMVFGTNTNCTKQNPHEMVRVERLLRLLLSLSSAPKALPDSLASKQKWKGGDQQSRLCILAVVVELGTFARLSCSVLLGHGMHSRRYDVLWVLEDNRLAGFACRGRKLKSGR